MKRTFTKYPSNYVRASSVDAVDQAMNLLEEIHKQIEYLIETYRNTSPAHDDVMSFYEIYNKLWSLFNQNHWDVSFVRNLGRECSPFKSLDAVALEKAYDDLKAYVMGNPKEVPAEAPKPVNKKSDNKPLQYIFRLYKSAPGTYNFMCQSAYRPDGTKKYLHNEVDVEFKMVNGEPYILSGYHIGTEDFDFDEGDPWNDYVEYYQPGITAQVLERIKNNDYEYH